MKKILTAGIFAAAALIILSALRGKRRKNK